MLLEIHSLRWSVVHDFYMCWSKVLSELHGQCIYQGILEHFMLPSADKLHGDAGFIFQQDVAPAHTVNKVWTKAGSMTMVLLHFTEPQSRLPCTWSRIYGLWSKERLETFDPQCKWPDGTCQSNLSFYYVYRTQAGYIQNKRGWCSNFVQEEAKTGTEGIERLFPYWHVPLGVIPA